MATAATVSVTPHNKGGFSVDALSKDSASTTTKLLQENHEKHHIFFNHDGFHSKSRTDSVRSAFVLLRFRPL